MIPGDAIPSASAEAFNTAATDPGVPGEASCNQVQASSSDRSVVTAAAAATGPAAGFVASVLSISLTLWGAERFLLARHEEFTGVGSGGVGL